MAPKSAAETSIPVDTRADALLSARPAGPAPEEAPVDVAMADAEPVVLTTSPAAVPRPAGSPV